MPFKKGGASYLVNYRYSFTGLLSDLGVPLGNEDIRFQDLSFKLHLPGKKNSMLSLFGLYGNSSNRFRQPTDTSAWETEKDLYGSIDYDADLAIAGFAWKRPVGNKGLWQASGCGRRRILRGWPSQPICAYQKATEPTNRKAW
ncbi:MAG: hypothetical protein R2795_08565 [Saprospiraceae bacterium]